ncbi:zinc finger CW-type PWWP domain protein 1-like [Battus philenor]|uniref:zinc finger CW-type PWWP domain protein 1-like n=1 Tax=Battus philenor TaxID=42288 RepID=UPI0035D04FE4
MDKATLPLETAIIPNEEACKLESGTLGYRKKKMAVKQPLCSKGSEECNSLSSSIRCKFKKRSLSSSYKEVLSQPDELPLRQRLLWLQKRRTAGLWVQCDDCARWRYLSQVIDRYDLPEKWYCNMNPDSNFKKCSIPEEEIHLHQEEDLIHSRFTAGSIVWVKLYNWPWWPAMVDDCPDTEQYYWLDGFSDIPTQYNVVFFDKNDVSRAWITNENIEPYSINRDMIERSLRNKKYKKRLTVAINQAEDALRLSLSSRLAKYSFLTRYKGEIKSPNISKATVEKYRKKLNRQHNIDFTISSDTDKSPSVITDDSVHENSFCNTPRNNAKKAKPKRIFKNVDNVNNFKKSKKSSTECVSTKQEKKDKSLTKTNSKKVDINIIADATYCEGDFLPNEPPESNSKNPAASHCSEDFDF